MVCLKTGVAVTLTLNCWIITHQDLALSSRLLASSFYTRLWEEWENVYLSSTSHQNAVCPESTQLSRQGHREFEAQIGTERASVLNHKPT